MPGKPKFQFVCGKCGEKFWPNGGAQRTCDKCKQASEAKRLIARKQIPNYSAAECDECGREYVPTSGHQNRCPECTVDYNYRKNLAYKEYLALCGVGSGNGQGRGPQHHSWQYGAGQAYINRKLDNDPNRSCELCKKDLTSVVRIKTGHGHWAVHHIDGNDHNNLDLTNLQLLCVTCHNRIHKNWLFKCNAKE